MNTPNAALRTALRRAVPCAARGWGAFGLCACALLATCQSAADSAKEADRQVYSLVESRRAQLGLERGGFTIEPRSDSLRQRLLRGEADDHAPLSLLACLEIAAENSRDYQTQKEQLYLSALDLTLERWRFQVHTSGELAAIVHGQGDEAISAETDAQFGLTRLLGSGALIAGDIGLNLARGLTTADTWHPIGDIGGSITQPLLRGFGGKIVEEPLTQAERDLVYAVRDFERFRRTFAVDVATRYYRLLQVMDSVSNQETNVANLIRLSERNIRLAEAGRLSDIEAGQARQNELSSQSTLLSSRERLERDRDSFKLFLGLPITNDLVLDAAELEQLTRRTFEAELDEAVVIDFALHHRLDHLTAEDERDDAGRRIEVAADAMRAGLDVSADVRVFNQSGKPFKYDFENASWNIGAVLDLPLDQLPLRNLYRASLISFEATVRACDRSADSIRADLRNELRETQTRSESYKIQLNAVALAERRIESTRLKLEAGRADTRDLLEAQESLLDAQNAATSALIDYTLAQLELYRDMEILRVDSTGIGMDEQLWSGASAVEQPAAGADAGEPPAGDDSDPARPQKNEP